MSGKLGKGLTRRLLLAFALVAALGGQAPAIAAHAEEAAQENNAPQAEMVATEPEEQTGAVEEPDVAVGVEVQQESQVTVENQMADEESNANGEPNVLQARAAANSNYSGGNTGVDKDGNTKQLYWVLSGETVEIPDSSGWSSKTYLSHQSGSTTWKAAEVDVLQKVYLEGSNGLKAEAQVIILPKTAKANIYLRYDNSVPDTLKNQDAKEYGPAGDNSSYFQITVDIKQMLDGGCKPYLYNRTSQSGQAYVYFSFASANGQDDTNQSGRKDSAISYWQENIEGQLSEQDKEQLNNKFGKDQYFGYVFKYEGMDGYGGVWHIDGALQKNPPNYVVELYHVDQTSDALFVLNDGKPGVKYNDFVTRLTEELATLDGGVISDVDLTDSGNKGATVTYKKDGIPYKRTISPLTNGTARNEFAIRPSAESFTYKEMTKDTFYLCQLQISDPEIQVGTLTITKKVAGSAADVDQHFKFQLQCDALKGQEFEKTLTYSYEGSSENDLADTSVHGALLKFDANSGFSNAIELKHGETVSMDLPAGCKVSIKEIKLSGNAKTGVSATVKVGDTVQEGFSASMADDLLSASLNKPVSITNGATTAVEFVNTADLQPQTGISTDSSSAIALGSAAIVGSIALFAATRRKHGQDAWKE